MIRLSALCLLVSSVILVGCATSESGSKGKGINFFTVEQDKELGAQVAMEIESNPNQYPILDSAQNSAVYQ